MPITDVHLRIQMAVYFHHTAFTWIFIFILANSVCGESTHRQLRDKLMQNYGDVFIRPVKETSTRTTVSIRPLFQNLINMDIRNQQFSIDCWIKMIWTDEYLTWNPSDYNGTKEMYLPSHNVWLPDITFYENVDLRFQRFKPDTIVKVNSTGTVEWFVPAIFVSGCPIRVTWYPFDLQVCNMTFGSFAYTGQHFQLVPADDDDSNQTRFLDNGVWDMIAVNKKQLITHFKCCEYPNYDVQYRLLFKRRPNFYIKNLIIPVILLAILSSFVFYLPPECGEKMTLSITNLLSLVVFEQTIAATMPPSGGPGIGLSPVIESFFLSMITIVALSVVATIGVIHLNSITHRPPPGWAVWLLLQKLPSLVCLDGINDLRWKKQKPDLSIRRSNISEKDTGNGVSNFSEKESSNGVHSTRKSLRGNNVVPAVIPMEKSEFQDEKQNNQEWKLVALVVDRFLMIVFTTATIVITGSFFIVIIIGSNSEYYDELGILYDEWMHETERNL